MIRKHLTDVSGVLGSGGLTNVATTHTLTSLTRGDGGTVATFTTSDPSIPMSILDASGNVLEVVLLTAWNSGTKAITITRAQEGYTAIAHAGSLAVTLSVVPSDLDSDAAWTAPTLGASWTNFGSPYDNAGYRKDAQGRVYLRGLIQNGTSATTIFTLPAGYRPTGKKDFFTWGVVAGGTVEITTGGAVSIIWSSSGYYSLDGLWFWTD